MDVSELTEEIIAEWSYQVENGIPELNNVKHLGILAKILRDNYKWDTVSIKEYIRNIIILKEDSPATKKAHALHLKSAGYGTWKNKAGKTVAKSIDGGNKLVKVNSKDNKQTDKTKKQPLVKQSNKKEIEPTKIKQQSDGNSYNITDSDMNAINATLQKTINDTSGNVKNVYTNFAKDVITFLKNPNNKIGNELVNKYNLSINKDVDYGEKSKLYVGAAGKQNKAYKAFSGAGNKQSTLITNKLKEVDALKTKGGFTKKTMTPNRIFNEKHTIEIKKSSKGAQIGNHILPYAKNYDYNNIEKLFIQKGHSVDESQKRVKELKKRVDRHNFIIDNIESIVGGKTLDVLKICDKCNVDTPQGIEFTKKATIQKTINRMKELGSDNSGGATKITQMFNELNNIKDTEKYNAQLNNILYEFSNHKETKATSADVTELIDYLRILNSGAPAYLPEASNFALGDILRLPTKQPTIQEIMNADDISSIFVSLEDRSVKKDAGGASESGGKIKLTKFKNPDTKDDLLKIIGNYKTLIHDGNIKDADKLILYLEKKYNNVLSSDKKYIEKTKSKSDWLKRNSKKLHDVNIWGRYYQLGYMLTTIHNSDIEFQGYQNSRYNVKSKNVQHDITDGVNRIAHLEFDPSQIGDTGKPNNPYPTRFHHIDTF